MKKILLIITYLIVLILGMSLGFLYSLYKLGSGVEVASMDIGDALPLKAEQISSGLKGYFNLWKGRLEVIALNTGDKNSLTQQLYNLDPGNIQLVVIRQNDSVWIYPESETDTYGSENPFNEKFDSMNAGFNIYFNPLDVIYHTEESDILIRLSDQVLKRRIAFQSLASAATPFWVGLYQQQTLVFASEDDYYLPLDSIFNQLDNTASQADTGSIWQDTLPWIYWKKFNIENKQYWMVISYKQERTP